MSTVYYSPLSTILPTDALPDQLGFVKDGLANLLGDVYFKDFQHSASARGDAAQYALTIVSLKAIELEIPGTGIFFVLNPGTDPGEHSELPISVRYEWPVLAWLREFDLESFSWQPGDFYQLVLTVLGVSERQVLERALTVFTGAADPVAKFVEDYNAFYETSLQVPNGPDPIGELQQAIELDRGEGSSLIVFGVYILDKADLDATKQRVEDLFASFFGGSVEQWFLRQITPKAEATLTIGAGIRFPRKILLPLDGIGGQPLPEPDTSMLTFSPGVFRFSTESGIGYDQTLGATLTPSQIGSTGFEIAITNAKLDLSTTTNIAEASADGRPNDFVGVFIEEAVIKLPPFFNHDANASSGKLVGRNLLIGTGGLSGTIGLEAVSANSTSPSLIQAKFGSFAIALSAVSLTFQQNAITASSIKGAMLIPGFEDAEGNDAEIAIDVSIGADGDFSVTASEEQGIEALRIPNVVSLELTSLSVGRKDDRFFVTVSGALDFEPQPGIGKFIPDKIEIQKLTIWDDGQIELEGGSIVLPSAATLQIGPVAISITAIHFGSLEQNERRYAFFGFDGGVSIDPGGVDARGDGIKFYFTVDGGPFDCFLRITSLAIDIIIPGSATPENAAVLISGYLAMKDDGQGGTEYAGGVSVSLPKLSIAGSAAMRYNPRLPSFLIDLGLEIATPILLGSTGLGLYGFRGLLGANYVAKKTVIPGLTEESEWWKYYKAKVPPDNREGIQASKFSAEEGFSLGAGVTLATAPDAGYAFSAKLFFLLSLPEVFLLQGQGQILKQRIGLDTTTDPPFYALVAISGTSIEAAFGVNYDIPDGGEIAQIDALLEMGFFWGNSGAWYINLGKDQPEDRRVQVLLFTIFKSYYYLMLSSSGIRTGAGASYELNKELGPFSVDFRAYMDMCGRITFKPLQVGGSIEVGGHLRLSIFGFGFSISASANLSGEAPHPFIITGKLKACVEVLWEKHCVTVELTWTFDEQLNYTELPLLPDDPATSMQAVNIHTLESYPLFVAKTAALPAPQQLASFIVPMDSYIDVELRQAVHPTKTNHPSLEKFVALGGAPEHTVLIPPQKAKSSQVEHELVVDSIEIFSWDPAGNDWKPYDVYAAATPLQLAPYVTTDLTKLPFGYWQKGHPSKHNKLRVLAQTPFSYMRPGAPYVPPEDLGVGVDDVFCAPEKRDIVCRFFVQTGDVIPNVWYSMPDVLYRAGLPGAKVIHWPWQGVSNGLTIDQDNVIRLLFPQPTARAELLLRTEGEAVEVTWYRRVPVPNPNGNAPLYEWQTVKVDEVDATKLADPVPYSDLKNPILRADVRGLRCARRSYSCIELPDGLATAEGWLALLERMREQKSLLAPSFTLDRELQALIGARESERVQYEATWNRENGALFIRLRDFVRYDCILQLEANVAYDRIERFVRIEPVGGWPLAVGGSIDPDRSTASRQPPTANDFLLVASIDDRELTIRGVSCKPLRECHFGCWTGLYRVCYETVEDAIYNEGLPSDGEVESEAQAMIEALSGSIQPIWRPDTSFVMKVVTTDTAKRDDGYVGGTYQNTFMIGWRTVGPVGHFHRYLDTNNAPQPLPAYQELVDAQREDQFKLATLQHYLDFARSYPNADGRLTNAKPLFYKAPRLDLFYLQPYVMEMYRDWDAFNGAGKIFSSLELEIVDPAPAPDAPDDPLMEANFDVAPDASIPPDVNIIINMTTNGDPCGDVDPPGPGIDIKSTFVAPDLAPLKLYTAVFRNVFRRESAVDPSRQEVHRYVFQTSRYADLAAQIGSWKLDAGHNAVYEVAVEADEAALAAAAAVITDPTTSSDDLKRRFADAFDRLIDGIFQLDALPPTTTTEFNILRLARTTRVLGILVRSPEPFNDPKMPTAELATTVRLEVGNNTNYIGLHSKDDARVFVTNANAAMNVPAGLHEFTFDDRRWNGTTYVNEATETASFVRN